MKKIFFTCALVSFAFSNTMYLNKDVEIKNGKNFIGNATLLSPVSVLEESGDKLKVRLEGYVNDNYQEEIVRNFTENENYVNFHNKKDEATFKGDVNPYIKMLEEAEDEYGEIWHKASIDFYVKKSDVVANKEEIYKKAKSLYEQTCSACHHLHDTKEYTVNQWPSNLESMISAGYVDLKQDEKTLILKYLQEHAKDFK